MSGSEDDRSYHYDTDSEEYGEVLEDASAEESNSEGPASEEEIEVMDEDEPVDEDEQPSEEEDDNVIYAEEDETDELGQQSDDEEGEPIGEVPREVVEPVRSPKRIAPAPVLQAAPPARQRAPPAGRQRQANQPQPTVTAVTRNRAPPANPPALKKRSGLEPPANPPTRRQPAAKATKALAVDELVEYPGQTVLDKRIFKAAAEAVEQNYPTYPHKEALVRGTAYHITKRSYYFSDLNSKLQTIESVIT